MEFDRNSLGDASLRPASAPAGDPNAVANVNRLELVNFELGHVADAEQAQVVEGAGRLPSTQNQQSF